MTGYIDWETFKTVIANTPLVSVDLIVRENGRVLLGRRVNRPAEGYWFTLGGRVLKNERINSAIRRIAETELGTELVSEPRFVGVFEHLYEDAIFDHVSTHYLNLGYEVEIAPFRELPKEQHSDYRWFSLEELMQRDDVHDYVKDYFTKTKGTVPQNQEE
ncbi:GDP-mannose mannosyl hydrolase [Sulfurimonas sp. HSL-1656]|uniref:GDP-mannose mannosyl hydrolase n=1 Tax=Thiomicrolovo subterrani TaxID=3131934 RepID=UPI0031F779ED